MKEQKKQDLGFMRSEDLNLTIGQLNSAISNLILNKTVDESSKILWAADVERGSNYEKTYNVPPGSVIFCLEWVENGESVRGTLKLEPPFIAKNLN
jgi:hypothetical protein